MTVELEQRFVGKTIGPYRVEGVIGQGGMGVVLRARQQGLDREVALKLMLGGSYATPEARARFVNEARVMGRLQHPGLLRIIDVGEHQDLVYYSMDLVNGSSLDEVLDRLDFRHAATLLAHVATALQYVHDQGLIHRDIKPSNVLLNEAGQPLLMDFGLVKELGAGEGLTATGAVLGTPAYMAPEQAAGEPGGVDHRADIYALGAILYHRLAGRPSYEGASVMNILAKLIKGPPKPPSAVAEVPPPEAIERVCLRAMARERDDRYPSARDFAADLARFVKGEPVLAAPIASPSGPTVGASALGASAAGARDAHVAAAPTVVDPARRPAAKKPPGVKRRRRPGGKESQRGPAGAERSAVGGGAPVVPIVIGAALVLLLAVVGVIAIGRGGPSEGDVAEMMALASRDTTRWDDLVARHADLETLVARLGDSATEQVRTLLADDAAELASRRRQRTLTRESLRAAALAGDADSASAAARLLRAGTLEAVEASEVERWVAVAGLAEPGDDLEEAWRRYAELAAGAADADELAPVETRLIERIDSALRADRDAVGAAVATGALDRAESLLVALRARGGETEPFARWRRGRATELDALADRIADARAAAAAAAVTDPPPGQPGGAPPTPDPVDPDVPAPIPTAGRTETPPGPAPSGDPAFDAWCAVYIQIIQSAGDRNVATLEQLEASAPADQRGGPTYALVGRLRAFLSAARRGAAVEDPESVDLGAFAAPVVGAHRIGPIVERGGWRTPIPWAIVPAGALRALAARAPDAPAPEVLDDGRAWLVALDAATDGPVDLDAVTALMRPVADLHRAAFEAHQVRPGAARMRTAQLRLLTLVTVARGLAGRGDHERARAMLGLRDAFAVPSGAFVEEVRGSIDRLGRAEPLSPEHLLRWWRAILLAEVDVAGTLVETFPEGAARDYAAALVELVRPKASRSKRARAAKALVEHGRGIDPVEEGIVPRSGWLPFEIAGDGTVLPDGRARLFWTFDDRAEEGDWHLGLGRGGRTLRVVQGALRCREGWLTAALRIPFQRVDRVRAVVGVDGARDRNAGRVGVIAQGSVLANGPANVVVARTEPARLKHGGLEGEEASDPFLLLPGEPTSVVLERVAAGRSRASLRGSGRSATLEAAIDLGELDGGVPSLTLYPDTWVDHFVVIGELVRLSVHPSAWRFEDALGKRRLVEIDARKVVTKTRPRRTGKVEGGLGRTVFDLGIRNQWHREVDGAALLQLPPQKGPFEVVTRIVDLVAKDVEAGISVRDAAKGRHLRFDYLGVRAGSTPQGSNETFHDVGALPEGNGRLLRVQAIPPFYWTSVRDPDDEDWRPAIRGPLVIGGDEVVPAIHACVRKRNPKKSPDRFRAILEGTELRVAR